MNEYYIFANNLETWLAHHGIKGQKWGVRRYQNEDGTLTSDGKKRYKEDVREAKRELKEVKKKYNKTIGKYILANRERRRESDRMMNDVFKAKHKLVDIKADYALAKGGEKAEMKQYLRAMRREGMSGSAFDRANHDTATRLYDHIARRKGKEYVQKLEKRVGRELVTGLVVSTAAAIGLTAVNTYLELKRQQQEYTNW